MSNFLTPEFILSCWVFIVGLCIGSFLNVVILRGLTDESIVFPSSKCPICQNKLKWWMNIPVLSYLLIGGKCHYCKAKVSIQYPVVELATGIFFLLIYLTFGISLETLFYLIAFSLLMVISVCDIKESVIIDIHAYILAFFGLIFNAVTNGLDGFLFSLIGAVVGFLVYELLARSGYLIAGQRAFGEGDSLIALGIGAFFGYKLMLVSVLLSGIIMAIFTFPYFYIHCKKNGKTKVCNALILALVLIVGAYFVTKTDIIKTFSGSIIFLITITSIAFWCVKQLLANLKNDEEEKTSFCMLPFGPAMAVSFLLIMFFEKDILTVLKSYFI